MMGKAMGSLIVQPKNRNRWRRLEGSQERETRVQARSDWTSSCKKSIIMSVSSGGKQGRVVLSG